jgi:hypothetical protein
LPRACTKNGRHLCNYPRIRPPNQPTNLKIAPSIQVTYVYFGSYDYIYVIV